jgi:hypothetical protein
VIVNFAMELLQAAIITLFVLKFENILFILEQMIYKTMATSDNKYKYLLKSTLENWNKHCNWVT